MVKMLLDTDTLSASRRTDDQPVGFQAFMKSIAAEQTFLSAVTVAEVAFGIQLARQRKLPSVDALQSWLEENVERRFAGRILSFDEAVAIRCGTLPTPDRRLSPDAMIAATALVHGLTVATRNVRDFGPLGVALVDPWSGPPATTGR